MTRPLYPAGGRAAGPGRGYPGRLREEAHVAGSMDGKGVLVTGATSGIGRVAAGELAGMGATLLLTARDEARGRAVAGETASRSGREPAVLLADLASQASIRRLAEEVRRRTDRLHVL